MILSDCFRSRLTNFCLATSTSGALEKAINKEKETTYFWEWGGGGPSAIVNMPR